MLPKSSLSAAIQLYSAPSLVKQFRRRAMPDDVLVLIKAAAGAPEAVAAFPGHVSRDPDRVREIAAFYIQQTMFLPNAGDYSVLGLTPGASEDKVREHKRWLLKWLHPDRNNNRWEQNYFLQVSQAADRILKHEGSVDVTLERQPALEKKHRFRSAGKRPQSRAPREQLWHGELQQPNLSGWVLRAIIVIMVCFAAILLLRNLLAGDTDLFGPLFQDTKALGWGGT
jgi:DnaJ domain